MDKKEINRIGHRVNINNKEWRVAQKIFRYGREWQYTLSHENIDGTFDSMMISESALEKIIKSGSKIIDGK
jgi:hypothetical protein